MRWVGAVRGGSRRKEPRRRADQAGETRVCSDGLPTKRLLDHLDAANFLEPACFDRADRLSRLFTEP